MSNIYYNWVLTNNTNGKIKASFNDIRTAPIVDHMENYELAVIRFTIPTNQLPILGEFPIGADATSQTLGYSVTIVNGASISQQFLIYTPIDTTTGTYIFSYSTLVDMINVALNAAAVASGAIFAGKVPYMTFDSASQLFSLYYPTEYIASGIQIWNNPNLNFLFPSFPYSFYNYPISFTNNGRYGRFELNAIQAPNSTPVTGYYQTIQEYPSTISLYQPRSLRFVSGNVPTRPESIPITSSLTSGSASSSNNNQQVILTDFDLPLANSISQIKPFIQYYQVGPYRYIDLRNHGSLNQFEMTIYWVDNLGRLHDFYIDQNQSITVKFMFKSKYC